jgi:hypothetical protein
MKIRDALFRHAAAAYAWWLAGIAVVFALLLLFDDTLSQLATFLIAVLVTAGGFGVVATRAGCPECRYPFVAMHHVFRLRYGSKSLRTNFCPHCGVSLDSSHSRLNASRER